MAKKASKKPVKGKSNPAFHEDLDGFKIRLNSFGEMESNIDVDKINAFLNDHVPDKKLSGQDDEEYLALDTDEEE